MLDERAFACWDPGDSEFATLSAGLPIPAGGGAERREDAGWVVDPGRVRIELGVSSRDIRQVVELELG